MPVSLGTVYNPYRAQQSKEYAYECWKDYTYGKNKLNISEEDMEILTEKYASEITKWEKAATKDLNIYEIEDEDFDLSSLDKKTTVERKERNSAKVADEVREKVESKKVEQPDMKYQENMNIVGGVATTASVAGAAIGTAACAEVGVAVNSMNSLMQGLGATTASTNGLALLGESTTSLASIGIQIACYASLATGILYQATRPNQEPRNALMTLQEQMQQLQSSLESGQEQLDTLGADLASDTEDMQSRTEDKQKLIEEKEELYKTCLALYTQIYDRVMNGEKISESDRAKLQSCGEQLAAMGKEIAVLKEEFDTEKEDMSANLEDQNTVYVENAEVITQSADTTSLAESFDEKTEELIKWQVASQTVNAAMGFAFGATATAIACTGFGTAVYAPAAAAGLAGGALSTAGAAEQGLYLTNVKSEIGDRASTQKDLGNTNESYMASIDTYNESIGVVGEQDLTISDGLLTAGNFEAVTVSDSQIEGAGTNEGVELADSSAQSQTGVNPFAQDSNTDPEIKNPFA